MQYLFAALAKKASCNWSSLGITGYNDSLFRRFSNGIEYWKNAVELGDFKKCHDFLVYADEDDLASVSAHLAFGDEESA